jgi:hypothetical protein
METKVKNIEKDIKTAAKIFKSKTEKNNLVNKLVRKITDEQKIYTPDNTIPESRRKYLLEKHNLGSYIKPIITIDIDRVGKKDSSVIITEKIISILSDDRKPGNFNLSLKLRLDQIDSVEFISDKNVVLINYLNPVDKSIILYQIPAEIIWDDPKDNFNETINMIVSGINNIVNVINKVSILEKIRSFEDLKKYDAKDYYIDFHIYLHFAKKYLDEKDSGKADFCIKKTKQNIYAQYNIKKLSQVKAVIENNPIKDIILRSLVDYIEMFTLFKHFKSESYKNLIELKTLNKSFPTNDAGTDYLNEFLDKYHKLFRDDFTNMNPEKRRYVLFYKGGLPSKEPENLLILDPTNDNLMPNLKFPSGITPTHGSLFIAHPYVKDLYIPYDHYNLYIIKERKTEFEKLLRNLGATEVKFINQGYFAKEEDSTVEIKGAAVNGVVNADYKKSKNKSSRQLFHDKKKVSYGSSTETPKVPGDLIWYEHEKNWQEIAESRIENNAEEITIEIDNKHVKFFTQNEAVRIKASLQKVTINNMPLSVSFQFDSLFTGKEVEKTSEKVKVLFV